MPLPLISSLTKTIVPTGWLWLGLICASPSFAQNPIQQATLRDSIMTMERDQEQTYEGYFEREMATVDQDPAAIAASLERLGQETGTRPAVLWVMPQDDFLHLVLITPGSEPVTYDVKEAPKATLLAAANLFRQSILRADSNQYQPLGERLYDWIIRPLAADYLKPAGVDTLLVCLWGGLRSLPLAALSDGEKFLVEDYSVASIPAFNLIDLDYQPQERQGILAMGAQFFRRQPPLPGVPMELSNILNIWGLPQERSFLNQDFTVANLQYQLDYRTPQNPFDVVHLATHAVFQPGRPENSFIQFWDQPLGLDELARLNWRNPPLELLVLSACETALGDPQAELGFGGVALQAGVKSALASLWSVSDAGTLALMTEFYQNLGQVSTKAEALRQAQLQLLQGKTRIEDDRLVSSRGADPLPESLQELGDLDLRHPFFWASFTLISSPW